MCFKGIWKIAIPKEALLRLIKLVDADEDGYVTIGEVRDLLKRYGKACRSSLKFARRKD